MSSLQNSNSLESSMSGSFITASTSSLASDTYQRAAKLFLTKSFVDSLNTLEPLLQSSKTLRETGQLSEKTWIKSWKLYFVLLDAAARQHEESGRSLSSSSSSSSASSSSSSISAASSVSSSWPKKIRLSLINKIVDGSLWKEVENEFGGSLSSAPPDIVFGLASLSVRHGSDEKNTLDMISSSLELYISSISDLVYSFDESYQKEYLKILDIYILRVLPLRNEYDYANEVIESSQFYDAAAKSEKKMQLIKSREHFARKKKQKEEADVKRKELVAFKEAERKLKQEQKEQMGKEQQQQQQQEQQQQLQKQKFPRSPSSSSSNRQLTPRRTNSPTPHSTASPVRGINSLVTYWRQRLSNVLQNTSFWRIFAFFIIILLSVTNPLARERARRVLTNIWRKLSETARMGFKVSFV